jgi:hypothetical protein
MKHSLQGSFFLVVILALLAACAAPTAVETLHIVPSRDATSLPTRTVPATSLPATSLHTPTQTATKTPTLEPSPTPTPEPSATATSVPDLREAPERWQSWPVVPPVTQRAIEIYRLGRELGRDPHSFSKIGDCQGIREVLMGLYDVPGVYAFGAPDAQLQAAVDWFRGSFNRNGMALMAGFNAPAILDPARADPDYCLPGETPIACEFRIHNPSFVIISLEYTYTNRDSHTYTAAMRQIIEYALANGVVPILATKADNYEGDHSINLATARLAAEYNLPLWNFWRAVQPLPYHGLDPTRDDGFHIAYGTWATRALTALQALDSVWQGVTAATGETMAAVTPTAAGDPIAVTPQPTPFAGSGGFVFGLRARAGADLSARGVYYYDYTASNLIQLAGEGYDFQSLSADGDWLLLSRGGDLYRLALAGGEMMPLTDGLLVESRRAALALEDGSIAVIAARGEEKPALWHLAADGSTWTRLAGAEIRPAALLPAPGQAGVLVEQGSCTPGTGCTADGTIRVGLDGSLDASLAGTIRPAFSSRGEYFAYTYYNQDGKSALGLSTLDRGWQWNLDLAEKVVADYDWLADGKEMLLLLYDRSEYSGKIGQNSLLLIQPYAYPGITTKDLPPAPLGLAAQVRWSPDRTRLLMPFTEVLQDGRYRLRLQVYNWYGESFTFLDDGTWTGDAFLYVNNIEWR